MRDKQKLQARSPEDRQINHNEEYQKSQIHSYIEATLILYSCTIATLNSSIITPKMKFTTVTLETF